MQESAIDAYENEAGAREREQQQHAAAVADRQRQIGDLNDQLAERTQQRDLAIAQNEVLQHRLEMLIKWQEAELQRLETEAQIHAMRRGLPPERDHDEPLH